MVRGSPKSMDIQVGNCPTRTSTTSGAPGPAHGFVSAAHWDGEIKPWVQPSEKDRRAGDEQ